MVYSGKNAAGSAPVEPKIGVFICHCGTNIAGSLDVDAVCDYAATLPHVLVAKHYAYMCSTPGQNLIKEAIAEFGLTGVVVAACTPRLHENTFRTATANGGLNPFRFEMANIRDQGSWVHMHDWAGGTEKAKDAVRIAVAKATKLEDLYPMAVPVEHRALVVGAGIAGIQASMDLAASGIETYLIEKEPTIGGRMSQLDKTFPT
ncbi:MAG TPA: NAD(P)-binding protein, partial [Methanocorpusculum sp.]|nr:NAD(P)-binding protein [Methanocorpusculum sp.]